jgi:hypothetical protein
MDRIFIPLSITDIETLPLGAARIEVIRCNAEVARLTSLLLKDDGKPCTCIEQLNANLEKAGVNTVVDLPMLFGTDGKVEAGAPMLATAKRDPRKHEKPVIIFCACCPVCGKKYQDMDEQIEIAEASDEKKQSSTEL